jgi:hypothetical protein
MISCDNFGSWQILVTVLSWPSFPYLVERQEKQSSEAGTKSVTISVSDSVFFIAEVCCPLLQVGSEEIVTYLMEKGADSNEMSTSGFTPLIVASAGGHLAVVKKLVAAGAEINVVHPEVRRRRRMIRRRRRWRMMMMMALIMMRMMVVIMIMTYRPHECPQRLDD